MGDRLYRVKTSFLEHAYDGKFMYVGMNLKSEDKIEDKLRVEEVSKALKRTSLLVPELKVDAPSEKKDLKKVFDRLKNFSDENIAYSVMDNAFAEGPYLDKD